MTAEPVNLNQALASFSDIYSPRIVGRVNDYDVRIAHTRGDYVWHVHEHTNEFFPGAGRPVRRGAARSGRRADGEPAPG